MENFEKLGLFYLGTVVDPVAGKPTNELLLYDARDLTTHAICVGMTGSGKTGLGIALLEEAALDNVPAIIIDPKGDLGNLLLTFPEGRPSDFRPWIDEGEAARGGLSPEQYAESIATRWTEGIKKTGQDQQRIQRLRDAVDIAIYTPGSRSGLPLNVLKSFAAPSADLLSDLEGLNERISNLVSGLLSLLKLDADPLQSREHILISQIISSAWTNRRSLQLDELIRKIQAPPFSKVGAFDLDSFFPVKDRATLALRVNNLLASPSFSGWIEGEPLDIDRLLHTTQGKPRLSILSIAHLSDPERMFFVSVLLNELVSWTRRQSGTNSLRAILYMDEIYGYFPPTANPPSKRPMLTLLKQARAYGLGCMLATQNPVDLDYKGLANAGTWFIGRLQTERDKARLLDGLEGVNASSGRGMDREKLDKLLSSLGQRIFLMNNVHEEDSVLFQTRWTLSYLAGPLSLPQIDRLTTRRQEVRENLDGTDLRSDHPDPAFRPPTTGKVDLSGGPDLFKTEPLLPVTVKRSFLAPNPELEDQGSLLYEAALLGAARLHFVVEKSRGDFWQSLSVLAPFPPEGQVVPWGQGQYFLDEKLPLETSQRPDALFAPLPAAAGGEKNYAAWRQELQAYLYQNHILELWFAEKLQIISNPGEGETEFRLRLAQAAREKRDEMTAQLRGRFGSQFELLEKRLRTARARVDREASEFKNRTFSTAISVGATVLGALFGRKKFGATNVSRAATAVRSAGSAARERTDVARAEESVEQLEKQLTTLENQLEMEIGKMEADWDPRAVALTPLKVRPRKSDLVVEPVEVVWVPRPH